MAVKHLKNVLAEQPQSQPLLGSNQVKNNAGGYVFDIGKWAQLHRFLILGTEGGTYYVSENKLSMDNANTIISCIKENGSEVIQKIVRVSEEGLAPKNDPAIFALALCVLFGDDNTKAEVFTALPRVCRTGTHFLHFLQFVTSGRGWGRYLRRLVGSWYTSFAPKDLAYQVAKYQSRDGWSHKDALILAHPSAQGAYQHIFQWIVQGKLPFDALYQDDFRYLRGHILINNSENMTTELAVKLINEYGLSRESIPTNLLQEPQVWEALLPHMPITALYRNLGTLSKCGILNATINKDIQSKLTNEGLIQHGRVHPMAILLAMTTYNSGHGLRSNAQWPVMQWVSQALEEAFYKSFKHVEPTNKRLILGIDVSGSMSSNVAGTNISNRQAAAVMAMVTVEAEDSGNIALLGFSHTLTPLNIAKGMTIERVCSYMNNLDFGRTDCALPILWASKNKVACDAFVTLTDNETWSGSVHPKKALETYRRESGIPAKNVVQAFAATEFSIADPSDPNSLDICGLDASSPQVLSNFITGKI